MRNAVLIVLCTVLLAGVWRHPRFDFELKGTHKVMVTPRQTQPDVVTYRVYLGDTLVQVEKGAGTKYLYVSEDLRRIEVSMDGKVLLTVYLRTKIDKYGFRRLEQVLVHK